MKSTVSDTQGYRSDEPRSTNSRYRVGRYRNGTGVSDIVVESELVYIDILGCEERKHV